MMTVTYRTRRACNQFDDVQVVEVRFAGTGCTALNNWLNDPTVLPIYKAQFMSQAQNIAGVGAISQEFTQKYNLATPAERLGMRCPNGTSIWRAARGSCWYLDREWCEIAVLKSCPNSACCLQNFKLCMEDDGVHVELVSTLPPAQPCGSPENPGPCATWAADGHCYFECDNDGIEDLLPPGGVRPPDGADISKSSSETNGVTEEAHLLSK